MPLSTSWKVNDWWVQRSYYSKWKKLNRAELFLALNCEHNFRNQPWRSSVSPPSPVRSPPMSTMPSCQMSRQEMTALWAEYDILQSQWLCDMPWMWCHMLETTVNVCAHVHMPIDVVCASTPVRWDKREIHYSSSFYSIKSYMLSLSDRKIGVKLPAGSDFSPVFGLI